MARIFGSVNRHTKFRSTRNGIMAFDPRGVVECEETRATERRIRDRKRVRRLKFAATHKDKDGAFRFYGYVI